MDAKDAEQASRTVTREHDAVGSSGSPPAGGGHQTPEQAKIVNREPGLPEGERQAMPTSGEPGRSPPVPGGSSAGHSDRKPSRGGDDPQRIDDARSKAERETAEREGQ